jgi:phage replication initiation protein
MNPNPNASHALLAEISARSEASTEISSERLQKSGFDFDALSPRAVIRGESLKEGNKISQWEKHSKGVILDWFRFTFLPTLNQHETIVQLREDFQRWYDFQVVVDPSEKGFRGYETSFDINCYLNGETVRLGILAFGGAHVGGTVLVDLSGTGTAPVNDWKAVHSTLTELKARITRCDLALDFLNGEVTFEDLKGLYMGGDFNSGGRIPNYRELSSGNSSKLHCEGRTIEIGKRTNGKMFRGYEKGKQLGNQESEWLRLEVELGSRDREIPHDVVLRPNEYFAGAHKALGTILGQFLEVSAEAIKTHQKDHETTLEKVLGHIKHQYGKYINVALPQFDDIAAMVMCIRVDGTPPRLQKTALAMHVKGGHDLLPVFGA